MLKLLILLSLTLDCLSVKVIKLNGAAKLPKSYEKPLEDAKRAVAAGGGRGRFKSKGSANEEGIAAVVEKVILDPVRGKSTRYRLTYNGLKIVGAALIVHEDRNYTTGRAVEGIREDLGGARVNACPPKGNIAKAKSETMRKYFPGVANDVKMKVAQSETIVYVREDRARIAHEIAISATDGKKLAEGCFYIDACTGEIYRSWNGFEQRRIVEAMATGYGGNKGSGKYRFDGRRLGKMAITKTKYKSKKGGKPVCAMENKWMRCVDCKNRMECANKTIRKPVKFDCYNSDASDANNGGYSPNNDCMYYGTQFFKMFQRWFNDSAPFGNRKVNIYTHFHKDWDNAVWESIGVHLRAFFGDGNDDFYPSTCADTIAHELCHGIIQANSNVGMWDDQSGGVNEAFADICGKAVEVFIFGKIQNGWTAGKCESKERKALRCFDNPECDGHSIGHASKFPKGTGKKAEINPHYSSGVFNKAFYLLATTKGWSVQSAAELFICANQQHWWRETEYLDGAVGVYNCAIDGKVGNSKVWDVVDTFKKVGIDIDNNGAN